MASVLSQGSVLLRLPRCAIAVLLCVFAFRIAAAQDRNSIKVAVTSRYAIATKKLKQHNYRLQLMPERSSLLAFGLGRIPRSLRSLKWAGGTRSGKAEILENAEVSLDSVYAFLTRAGSEITYKVPSNGDYLKQKALFLAGRRTSNYIPSQWINLSAIEESEQAAASFRTRGFLRTHHEYTLDWLPGAMAWELPALDPWFCEPAQQKFFKLRKLQGWGIDRIPYQPYRETSRVIVRNSFEVYFPHNEVVPHDQALNEVIRFLENNDYAILEATLEGGCSVEGTAERNRYLQQQRARVLQKALHRYADELIRKDTVMLTDFVAQFRTLIKTGPHAWIDTLSNDSLIWKVNNDESLRATLEPVFVQQRKAALRLVVAKRLTRGEQFEKFRKDLGTQASLMLSPNKQVQYEAEGRVFGMLDRLFRYHEEENVTADEVLEILRDVSNGDALQVMIGYYLLRKFEKLTGNGEGMTWEAYWHKYEVKAWLGRSQGSAIMLAMGSVDKQLRGKYMRMLTDFQAYTYQFVELGLIDPNELCTIPYPERNEFMGLILNQYAYLYELSIRGVEGDNPDHPKYDIHCFPRHSAKPFRRDSVVNTDKFIDNLETGYKTKQFIMIGDRLTRKKNFDLAPKGPYYFLLKQHYVKNNAAALQYVQYDEDKGQVALNIFNLWHLVSLTVREFDPFENHFYDEEVQLPEMDKLITALKKSDQIICRPVVNQLYLEYHLKMLYYLERYAEPGNPKHAQYATESLKFIAGYYKARAKDVNTRLSLHIVKQMNLFNWLPGPLPGAWYGYDLLNEIAKRRVLYNEERKLYAHYLRMYNPQMKKVPTVYDKEEMMAMAKEGY